MTSRLANPTRLTMRRIDFNLRRWGQFRRVRYLKCEVDWRWSECGCSWQLSCKMKIFAYEFCGKWGSRGESPSLMAIKVLAETGFLEVVSVNDRKAGM